MKINFTVCTGGAVTLPGEACTLTSDVRGITVGLAGSDGAFVVHKAILHMIIMIKITIILFKAITVVTRGLTDKLVE